MKGRAAETKNRRWLAILLLAVLIFGSVIVVGLAAWLYVANAEQRQELMIRQQSVLLVETQNQRIVVERLFGKSQELMLESAQQAARLQLCALKPKLHEVCRSVAHEARRLIREIEKLQHVITQTVVDQTFVSSPSSPTRVDSSVTPRPTPPPHVGNSDQCPAKNPSC